MKVLLIVWQRLVTEEGETCERCGKIPFVFQTERDEYSSDYCSIGRVGSEPHSDHEPSYKLTL